ncbi:MAG: dihydroneopterin aldolase [cyanobacterium endosymbiont of Rhopalodia musculus]|uniref:dihydroneopterin aldolase n=1 Tax=cyanobacterium endosymbiont of Epithemia clementina EcSB TaxID=3034674 RepID=UPI0024807988|nr:dihydroneopterin aldolase [cyanobacterium endosymbiont of Epithemia clementina EcSB]WGT67448.1 dihydroneopterin aldolase [cyanobacterium endosymbiont of Epithemia clementina EcSB]
MEFIEITKIRSYGYTGYLPEEQVLGQWFEVDIIIGLDLTSAGNSDQIKDTLDYRQVIAIVKRLIATEKFALVEKLAEVIAQKILILNKVQLVRVRLSKLAAPIPDYNGKITIDMTKRRKTI